MDAGGPLGCVGGVQGDVECVGARPSGRHGDPAAGGRSGVAGATSGSRARLRTPADLVGVCCRRGSSPRTSHGSCGGCPPKRCPVVVLPGSETGAGADGVLPGLTVDDVLGVVDEVVQGVRGLDNITVMRNRLGLADCLLPGLYEPSSHFDALEGAAGALMDFVLRCWESPDQQDWLWCHQVLARRGFDGYALLGEAPPRRGASGGFGGLRWCDSADVRSTS